MSDKRLNAGTAGFAEVFDDYRVQEDFNAANVCKSDPGIYVTFVKSRKASLPMKGWLDCRA